MTLAEFSQIYALLAMQLNDYGADEPKIRAYYEAMKDLEPEYVAMAAKTLARDGGSADVENRHWFPKTSEWRAAAIKAQQTRIADLKERMRKLPEPLCAACEDTGWERTGDRVRRCGCASLRRLEVLGRRPMPALTGETITEDTERINVVDLAAAHVKGMH